ncbi:ribosomal protein L9 [Nitzschia inconspicua]|uniref:50S ribosomal protein L9, chloroplastic n=1 Tax=Nitzschia inconspicua TaxID=303405 RepID=A0A9K3K943_9STRA|nr:ribosomal protein L9 [Nitzschia inconspicua]KAG7362503.1 ribosomal protein L9 [Nitzschia inconspicua]
MMCQQRCPPALPFKGLRRLLLGDKMMIWVSFLLVALVVIRTDAFVPSKVVLTPRTRIPSSPFIFKEQGDGDSLRNHPIVPAVLQQQIPSSCAGVNIFLTRLAMSKRKSGTTASSSSSSKMQVRLLRHIAGTGQAGDIIMVTPAFYNNKLRPKHLAEPITDEQVQKLTQQQQAQQQAILEAATKLQQQLSQDNGFVLRFPNNKTGPDGKKLFGGIGTKKLLQQLQEVVNDPYLQQKQVKVLELSENGTTLQGDIKETGVYVMKLQLTKDITVKIQVVVE